MHHILRASFRTYYSAFASDDGASELAGADADASALAGADAGADASAGAAPTLPEAHESWYGISLVNSPGENSYPISTFTYLLLYENLNNVTNDPDTAQAMIHLIHWMITDGQKYNESLEYVPIAAEVKQIGIDGLKRVQFNGQPAWVESDTPSYVQPATPEESVPKTYEQPIVVQQTNNQSLSSEMELLSFYITALIALIAIAVILVIILIIVNMSLVASIKKQIRN